MARSLPDGLVVPEPAGDIEPEGYVVVLEDGDRIHFLDWGGPEPAEDAPGILLIHGVSQTAWIWSPVARRLRGVRRTVAMDLRGHGLSDAPPDGYDLQSLAVDAVAVAEGSGLLVDAADRVVVAGHGFGALVAAEATAALGGRCAGLVLVDGGWEELEAATGLDVDEFLRGLEEPPEVLASIGAFLADRAGFDPTTWDADQDRAARATVVETHAGRVVPATRPHALEACVRTMFEYDPDATFADVAVQVSALVGADDETRSRARALEDASAARVAAGRGPIEAVPFPGLGHNLMRYRPVEVSRAILAVGSTAARGGPFG
jgi:pimeloyl-ACP methyl ester carboxylesterase